jgi:hypothetical protein
VESRTVTYEPLAGTFRITRARAIRLLGPLTVLAGVAWAFVQPYRLTILHPHGQGFWWLVAEPPLLVMGAGVFFSLVVARPLLDDLMRHAAGDSRD